jgi:predicted DNA-binding transcriptional regulator YafY
LELIREGTRTGSLPNCGHFIRELEVSGRTVMRDLDFLGDNLHAPAFFKDTFGISQADKPWKVRLLFAREVAPYIRERVWHRSQALRQRRDGALEFRLQTSSRKELTRWILSWMPHVQVLAPRQLRDRVRQRMREGLARCG